MRLSPCQSRNKIQVKFSGNKNELLMFYFTIEKHMRGACAIVHIDMRDDIRFTSGTFIKKRKTESGISSSSIDRFIKNSPNRSTGNRFPMGFMHYQMWLSVASFQFTIELGYRLGYSGK